MRTPLRAPLSTPISGIAPKALLAVAAVLLAGALVLLGTSARQPAAPTSSTCIAAAVYLETIVTQERQAAYQVAATNARTALTAPQLCPGDRQILAEKAVADSLEALWGQKFTPDDLTAQGQQVDAYISIAKLAHDYGVALPSRLQLAQRAYGSGQFTLCRRILEDAWSAGEFTATDQPTLQLYTSALYNQGYWLVIQGTMDEHQLGLQLLVTSLRVDRKYAVGSGEAWGLLRQLLGPDERGWPDSIPTPILQ